ncbi:retrovirus-related pol polyprotein from transposon TNT 1-94, partial [Tanacetum coccineum]
FSADPFNKGKSPMVEEDPPIKQRSFRQLEEDRLGAEAAKKLYEEEQAELAREQEERQRKRQEDVLNSANPDVTEENFVERMVKVIAEMRRQFETQRFIEKRNKPMTYAHQKNFMRTYVKNQSSVIYSTGWTLKHVKSFSDATLQEEFNKIRHAVENLQTQILRRSIKRPGADLDQPTSKKSKSNEAQHTSVPPASNPSTAGVPSNPSPFFDTPPHSPEVTPVSPTKPSAAAPSNASSHPDVPPETSVDPTVTSTPPCAPPVFRSSGPRTRSRSIDADIKTYSTRRKSLASRKMPSSEVDLTAPDDSFIQVLLNDESDDTDDSDPLFFWHAFAAWEVVPTGLGDVNALYFTDKSSKYFTHLREILHLLDRQDLSKLYGMVVKHYEVNPLAGTGLILWGDLHVLFESTTGGSSVEVWNDQKEWVIRSWKLFPFSGVHVLETFTGKILYMFADTPYPLSVSLMKKMLKHKLEVEIDGVGNDMTHAVQLIKFIKNQLASYSEFMLWNSLLLLECSSSSYFAAVSILKLTLPTGRYVVPTGRVIATDSVIVATSGYVVPAAYDISPVSKAKRSSFKTKVVPSSKGRLNLLHMDLCGPMRVASINGKKYILVIVDDYSRYTWTLFLRSKDETPEVLKDFLTMIQRNLQAPVISVRTDRGTEFLNKTLNAFFKQEGIEHQTSTPRTPEQNGVVERRNRTLVEAARTMLSASKLPLFFWAEAIATACYTQNRSIIIPTHEKTAYHIINDRKPSIKHLYIFGCTCYLTRDGENLDKMKEKGDPCILVGYSTQSKGYKVYNKRTRLIVESIHLRFDEIKEMSETSVANDTSGLVPQRQKESDYDNSGPDPQLQNVSPSADTTVPSQQELDLLFGPLYDKFFNTGTSRVNKSSTPTDNSAQQHTLPSMNIHPTTDASTPTHVNAEENNNDQAKFTNPFCTPVQEVAESSLRNIGNSNMHTFNQPQDSKYRWTKDHPLTQVHGNPSKSVQTRRQLATDPKIRMFALTVSTAEPKNIKEAMADSAWIEAMQEELHQFDRLQVWELLILLKWLWKNKKDKDQTIIRNKARLVAKGYVQEEGIDFEESFAPVAR